MKYSDMVPVSRQESGTPSHVPKGPSLKYRSSVIDAIYENMSQVPQAIAVTDGDLEWTYDILRRQSDKVSRNLASHGITRGSVVGMHLPRCADAIATMLGIMASGCVYLPLDPSYPSARLRLMLDLSGAAAVISDGSDQGLYGSNRILLPPPSQIATEPEVLEGGLPTFPAKAEAFRMEDLAYILFTSGSTGEPRGVMVTHENISLMTEWSAKMLHVTSFDASATATSLSFDASFHETLLPLSIGGTIHIIPHALALGHLTRQVSFVACTPTVASELLRADLLPPLKVLMLGGEILAPDVAARILSSGRVGRLLNCYGPTECTVCVTVAEVTAPVPEVIPIGRQVPGTEVFILDENGQRLPDGERGEICIFGGQVADGYINDPAGTTERFVVGPGSSSGSRRYFRTGDLGYRLDDGAIYFAGRADRQVKINGCRVELGEVDAVLRSHSQISEAATIVQDGNRMIAYVVPTHASTDVDVTELKRFLSENLPRFMLPAEVVVLADLPKTVSGKLDVSALPEWSASRPAHEPLAADEFDEFTARVVKIIADVTGFAGQIRPSDDFIHNLGGTSLDIVRVLVELERESGRRMRINDALADTSVAGIANLLREETVSPVADFAFNTNGDALPLFFIHSYLGGMLRFRRLAELLPPNQPVYGFQVYCTSEQVGDKHTISSLAQEVVNRIREVQPTGRITMIGQSAGGLIAFEAARKILAAGDPEPRVLLMDSVAARNAFAYYWGDYLLNWRAMIGNRVRLPWRTSTRLPQAVRPREGYWRGTEQSHDLMALTQSYEMFTNIAIRRYRVRTYSGSITVMRTRQGRFMALGQRDLGWRSVARGTLRMIDVPGTHISMLEVPHIHFVAAKLTEWLTSE